MKNNVNQDFKEILLRGVVVIKKTIIPLLLGTFFTSCASLNDIKFNNTELGSNLPFPVIPESELWANSSQTELPTIHWVDSFSDSVLRDLVQEAFVSNPSMLAAKYRVDAANARIDISDSERFPSLSANSRLSRNENAGSLPGSTNISTGLSTSWEYDLWGRIENSIDASLLDFKAVQEDYNSARLSVAGQVSLAWFDLIEARLLSELSNRTVATKTRALDLTQRRFEGGVTGSSDVRLARSSLASAQASQSLQLQRLSSATRRVEILLRRYPAAELKAPSDLPELPKLKGVGTPGYVLRNRPDLLEAEYRLKSQGLQIEIAKKNLLPRISLDGSGSLASRNLNDFFEIDALVASLAGSISAPIFQGGRLKADVSQQKSIMKSQLQSYAGLILNAYLEVENAIGSEKRLSEQEKALRISLNEAQKAESRLELRYTEGLATILQLLDAQSRSLTAEGQLISSRKERLSNRVRLHVALGGGVELLKLSHGTDAQAFEIEKKE